MQYGHHVAQKLTMVTLLWKSEMLLAEPSSMVKGASGAGSPFTAPAVFPLLAELCAF